MSAEEQLHQGPIPKGTRRTRISFEADALADPDFDVITEAWLSVGGEWTLVASSTRPGGPCIENGVAIPHQYLELGWGNEGTDRAHSMRYTVRCVSRTAKPPEVGLKGPPPAFERS